MNLRSFFTALVLLPLIAHGSVKPHQELRDIFYGEILFHAYQDEYFEAISHLDIELGQYRSLDEPQLDTLHWHRGQAEFAVGDLELHLLALGYKAHALVETDVGRDIQDFEPVTWMKPNGFSIQDLKWIIILAYQDVIELRRDIKEARP